MQQQGLFKCSRSYYVAKLLSNFSLLAIASGGLAMWHNRLWAFVLSACMISLFWQQSGWLAHDFLHHQVFRSRRLNNFMGLILGCVFLVSIASMKPYNVHTIRCYQLVCRKQGC